MVCFGFTFANALQKGDKYSNKIAGSRLSTVQVLNGDALRRTARIPTGPAGLQSDTMNLPATTLPSKTVQSAPWQVRTVALSVLQA